MLEINAQHDRDAEDELSEGNGMEDVVGNVFLELNRFLGMATGAKPPSLSGKRKEVRVPGIVVGAVYIGEALVQVTASQV